METYAQRVTRFFLQSIHTLKKESGSQRWNEICENASFFAFMKLPFPSEFSQDSLWQLFFEPPATVQESPILLFFSKYEEFTELQFILLQILNDPPDYKWQELYEQYA